MRVLEFRDRFFNDATVSSYYLFGRVRITASKNDELFLRYDIVYTSRRWRKIISKELTSHIVKEFGFCMEGDSCPVPIFYVSTVGELAWEASQSHYVKALAIMAVSRFRRRRKIWIGLRKAAIHMLGGRTKA